MKLLRQSIAWMFTPQKEIFWAWLGVVAGFWFSVVYTVYVFMS
jgi:hypothetical protein